MSEVVARRERYGAVAPGVLYESEFERIVKTDADILFPGFFYVEFKARVQGPSGTRKADYALIDREYRRWWVVEVELSHHPFHGHVLPQVEALTTATYSDAEAHFLASQHEILDLHRLRDMMLGDPPRVLVIVNEPCPAWVPALRFVDASLLVIAVHRSKNGLAALVMEGEYPTVSEEVMTACRRDEFLRIALIIESPAALPVKDDEIVEIVYQERVTTWKRVNGADRTWLMPVSSRDAIDKGTARIEIVKVNGEALEFRQPKRGKRR